MVSDDVMWESDFFDEGEPMTGSNYIPEAVPKAHVPTVNELLFERLVGLVQGEEIKVYEVRVCFEGRKILNGTEVKNIQFLLP